MGAVDYGRKSSDVGDAQFRRSLYWVKDAAAGEVVTPGQVNSVRLGFGLPHKRLDELVGRTLARDLTANTATSDEDFVA